MWPFLVYVIIGVATAAFFGTYPNPYEHHDRGIPLAPPHPYPWLGVLLSVILMTLEIGILYAIIRPSSYTRSLPRALSALLVTLIFVAGIGLLLIHAPPYVLVHWLWAVGAAISSLALLLVSTVARLRGAAV